MKAAPNCAYETGRSPPHADSCGRSLRSVPLGNSIAHNGMQSHEPTDPPGRDALRSLVLTNAIFGSPPTTPHRQGKPDGQGKQGAGTTSSPSLPPDPPNHPPRATRPPTRTYPAATIGGEHPAGTPASWTAAPQSSTHRSSNQQLRAKKQRSPSQSEGLLQRNPGGVLLSQGATPQVPSALAGLTAVFGMGTGVSPPPWPPETVRPRAQRCTKKAQRARCGPNWATLSVP